MVSTISLEKILTGFFIPILIFVCIFIISGVYSWFRNMQMISYLKKNKKKDYESLYALGMFPMVSPIKWLKFLNNGSKDDNLDLLKAKTKKSFYISAFSFLICLIIGFVAFVTVYLMGFR